MIVGEITQLRTKFEVPVFASGMIPGAGSITLGLPDGTVDTSPTITLDTGKTVLSSNPYTLQQYGWTDANWVFNYTVGSGAYRWKKSEGFFIYGSDVYLTAKNELVLDSVNEIDIRNFDERFYSVYRTLQRRQGALPGYEVLSVDDRRWIDLGITFMMCVALRSQYGNTSPSGELIMFKQQQSQYQFSPLYKAGGQTQNEEMMGKAADALNNVSYFAAVKQLRKTTYFPSFSVSGRSRKVEERSHVKLFDFYALENLYQRSFYYD